MALTLSPGLITLAAAAAAALLATGIGAALARRIGFTAPFNPVVPQQREPAALGGGVALFIGIVAGLAAAAAATGAPLLRFGAALLPALIVGLADDISPFRPLTKLLLQALAAALGVAVAFAGTPPAGNPGLMLAGVLLGMTLVNAINFLDASDGYAASISAVSFVGLAWFGDSGAAVAVGGACVGFLAWNWPPARIYMGETGVQVLGMAGALLVVAAFHRHWSGAAAIACFGVALIELVLLVFIRMRRGIPFWRGSPDHSALRLQALGFSKARAALAAASVQAGFVAAAAAIGGFTR
ncbi:MAG TPA: hypothetical protein VMS43_05835 [Allosphingosinicella sp.]|nr:hypothetical protein [Allosphingosinicella sp.]